MLSDPAITGLLAVCTPEEMPVTETIELATGCARRPRCSWPASWSTGSCPSCSGARRRRSSTRWPPRGPSEELDGLVDGDAGPVLEAARLAVTMRRTRSTHLERLREGIDPDVPLLYLPYLFTRSHGLRTTRQVAGSLGEELGL